MTRPVTIQLEINAIIRILRFSSSIGRLNPILTPTNGERNDVSQFPIIREIHFLLVFIL